MKKNNESHRYLCNPSYPEFWVGYAYQNPGSHAIIMHAIALAATEEMYVEFLEPEPGRLVVALTRTPDPRDTSGCELGADSQLEVVSRMLSHQLDAGIAVHLVACPVWESCQGARIPIQLMGPAHLDELHSWLLRGVADVEPRHRAPAGGCIIAPPWQTPWVAALSVERRRRLRHGQPAWCLT